MAYDYYPPPSACLRLHDLARRQLPQQLCPEEQALKGQERPRYRAHGLGANPREAEALP